MPDEYGDVDAHAQDEVRYEEHRSKDVTDGQYIEAATQAYASDDLLIQQSVVEGGERDQVVDRVDGGAWVMAWVFVGEDDA